MKLTQASSPHIRGDFRTSRLMQDVMLALVPALFAGCTVLGIRCLYIVAISMMSAVVTEVLFQLVFRKPNTVMDSSALVTGMLLAMTLPSSVPYWIPAVGSAFAIIFAKLLSGGLGQNVFNPALMGRAFLMLLFPKALTRFPALGVDGVTGATPLHHMVMPSLPEESILDMFLGNCPGCIGEISSLALIAGGVYLVIKKVISPRIPLAYLASVALITLVFPKTDAPIAWMLYSLLSGGVMLGAIFMATDYATSPVTGLGQIIFGAGCGVLTVVFRYYGLYPEGVTYAILLMNLLVWTIDRYTAPRRYGKTKGEKQNA